MSRSTSSSSTSSSSTISTDSFESAPGSLEEVKSAATHAPAASAAAPPSQGGSSNITGSSSNSSSSSAARFVNVELIRQMMAMQRERGDINEASDPHVSITDVIRTLPPLTDASWVTEEMQRICADYNFWMSTNIPPTVWAPPGTPKCPFSITDTDVRRFIR